MVAVARTHSTKRTGSSDSRVATISQAWSDDQVPLIFAANPCAQAKPLAHAHWKL
jgi:hypothetical protein